MRSAKSVMRRDFLGHIPLGTSRCGGFNRSIFFANTGRQFFQNLAIEVKNACRNGRLQCDLQLIPELPQWSWAQFVDRLKPNTIEAVKLLLLLDPPLDLNDSKGDDELLATSLRFLNYPFHSSSADAAFAFPMYVITGWYYKSGGAWISIRIVSPDGSTAEAAVIKEKKSQHC